MKDSCKGGKLGVKKGVGGHCANLLQLRDSNQGIGYEVVEKISTLQLEV